MTAEIHEPAPVSIIGAGRAAIHLAWALVRAGGRLDAVWSRSRASAEDAVKVIGQGKAVDDPVSAFRASPFVIVGVSDDAIEETARSLAAAAGPSGDRLLAHLSGSLPAEALAPLEATGATIGAIHPLRSLPEPQAGLVHFVGSFFAVDGSDAAVARLGEIAARLGGTAVRILPGKKALYHAGATFASNFVVTLVDAAERLLVGAGFDRAQALAALLPLVKGTVENVERLDAERALTGPIARGDAGTVSRQIAALRADERDLLDVYRAVAQATLDLARRKKPAGGIGGAGGPDFRAVEEALRAAGDA